MNTINLKELEKKAFRSTFQDGLCDIFIGVMIIQFAVVPLFSDLHWGDFWSTMVYLPVILATMFFVYFAKKHIVAPRIGSVKFGKSRKRKFKKIQFILMMILLIGVCASFIFFYFNNLSQWIYPMIFTGVFFVGFSLMSYLMDFFRLFIYGILVGISFPIGEILFQVYKIPHHGYPVVFSISGGIMVCTGIILLSRFIKQYPREV